MSEGSQEIFSSTWNPPNEDLVETALRSLPLAEAPAGLAESILSQIEMVAPPRFRLTWMDLLLCGFAAGMLLLLFLVVQWLPPYLDLYLRLEILNWHTRLVTMPWMLLASLGAALAGFTAALFAGQICWQAWNRPEKQV